MRYYTEDISKVPFRQLRNAIAQTIPRPGATVVAVLILLLEKIGIRLPSTHGVGLVGTEQEVDPSELPAPAIARWAPILEQLSDLGFLPLKSELMATVGTKLQCSTILLDPLGETVAVLEWTRMPVGEKMEELTPLEFNSYRDGEPDIVTGVVRKQDVPLSDMLNIASVEMISLEDNLPVADCYAQHRQRTAGKQILSMSENRAVQLARQRGEQRLQEFLDSGLLRELKPAEIKRLEQVDLTALKKF